MILFVAGDSGPAQYLAYVMLGMHESQYKCIATRVSGKVLDQFCIKYFIDDIEIQSDDFDIIITGTRFEDSIDKKWVSIGLQNKIKTISIIDHWSLYHKRFETNGKHVYPDIICVNDKQAKLEAENDGIPAKKIHIVGSPVLENTKKKEYSPHDELQWKIAMGIGYGKKVVTFISEDFKSDFPKNSPHYEGFDEFEVLSDLSESIDTESVILVKLHPAENSNKYDFL